MPLLLISALDALGIALVLAVIATLTGHARTRRRDRKDGRTPAERRALRNGRVPHVERLRRAGGL